MNITMEEAKKKLIADILISHMGNDKILNYLQVLYPDNYNIDFSSQDIGEIIIDLPLGSYE